MRQLFCGLIIALLLTSSVGWAKPVYFMSAGAGPQFSRARHAGFGGSAEIGLRKHMYEVYTGVDLGMYPGQDLPNYEYIIGGEYPYGYQTLGWTGRGGDVSFQRVILGGRFLMEQPGEALLCGFLGGGISLGKTRKELRIGPEGYNVSPSQERSEVSGVSAGVFGECGLRFYPARDLSFDVGLQAHAFNAVFPIADGRSTETDRIRYGSVMARMVYTL